MRNGRHAVSVDEGRCYFRNHMGDASLPGQSLKQVWFAGVHSDIGYPTAATHNSLTWYCWILESFPHSYYDPVLKKAKSRIRFGAGRFIPEGSVLHVTVNEKRWRDQSYKPSNLPASSNTEHDLREGASQLFWDASRRRHGGSECVQESV